MATQTGSYDFKAQKAAHDEAAQVATNYIFKTTGHDAWVCDEDAGPNPSTGEAYGSGAAKPTTGWRIGSVFELVRQGVSWFKLWVENNVPKLRLGQANSKHILLDGNGMSIYSGSETLANQRAFFGEWARIGNPYGGHSVIDINGFGSFTGNDYDIDSNFNDELFYIGYDSNYDYLYSRRCGGRIIERTYGGDGTVRPIVHRFYPDGADLKDTVAGSGTYLFSIDGGSYAIDAGDGSISFDGSSVQVNGYEISTEGHGHYISEVAGLQTALSGKSDIGHTHTKSEITDFSHTHAQSDVTGLASTLAGKSDTGHTHAASDIASGVLPESRGGTGASSFGDALDTLMYNRAADEFGEYGAIYLDDDDAVHAGGMLPVKYGGTGAGNASDARANLGAAAASHTHDASDIDSGTLDLARIPTGTSSDTVALGDHAHSEYAAASHNHAASAITSGALGVAHGGTGVSTLGAGLVYHSASGTGALSIATAANVRSVADEVKALFSGTAATTVTLSETAANFKLIVVEIVLNEDANRWTTVVTRPSAYTTFATQVYGSSKYWLKGGTVRANGTSCALTQLRSYELGAASTSADSNTKISRVWGIR